MGSIKPEGRNRWIANGSMLARQILDSVEACKISGDEILFVIVSRGGLLLLPAVLTQFPNSLISMIACSRSQGISHSMPMPTDSMRLVVVVDAVVATGTTALQVVDFIRERVGPSEYWMASLSCTSTARERLVAQDCKVFTVTSDILSPNGPTQDLDGADAGDLLQGFASDPE